MTELIITSSVLILVVILLRHFLKGKISLRLQYALWALVLLRLLVPLNLFSSPVSIMNFIPINGEGIEALTVNRQTVGSVTTDGDTAYYNLPQQGEEFTANATAAENAGKFEISVSNRQTYIAPFLRLVWITGIVIVGLILLLSNFSFSRKLKKTRKLFHVDNCKLPVYEVEALPSPCLFGLFRPAIYITPDVAGDETKLRHVLAHELTHYRHGDHIWSALRAVCLAVHWYNPLVWMAAALSRRDSELACDEDTIRRIGEENRTEYGRTLIGLTCEKRKAMDLLCCATTMTDGKKGIKERISLIAKKPKLLIPAVIAVVLVAIIAVGCTFTGAKNEEEIVPLTADDVEQYNKAFEPLLYDEQGNLISVNPLSHFFTSYYDSPEDINLAEFLRHFPSDGDVTDEAEFASLKTAGNWPFGTDATLDGMPVPIHRFTAKTVNEALKKHMDIALDDLSGVGMDELIYLEEYDAYYNFTSDFAAGTFICTSGEKQGDIIRLYSEHVTLTLKLKEDGFLIVSHQRVGDRVETIGDSDVAISIEVEGDFPEALIDYATEYVAQQVDFYNEVGKEAGLVGAGTYAITDAKITGLTMINTGTAGLTSGVNMYLLEYRLRPDSPENVVMAGGMRMEEINGESWITEWGSTGQPYLLLAWNDGGAETVWQRICVTNTDVIMADYGTPEMLDQYGNKFTAAAMELYRKNLEIRTIGQVSTVYTREEELGHTAVREVAELLMTELLNDLKTEQDGRTFTIMDWKNLSVSSDRMYDAWIVTGDVEVLYEGILSPIGDSDMVPQGEYVSVSIGERHLTNQNGVYNLSLPYGEPQQAILEPPLLTREMSVGIGVFPDYADDDILIFHGYFGLFVYDLKAEKITFAADLEKAVGTTIIQGSEGAAVRVSADGNTIQLFFYPEQGEPVMAYTIDSHTGSYNYDHYAPLDANFVLTDGMYDRFSFGTLGELTYTDDKNSYFLFSDWDWAN